MFQVIDLTNGDVLCTSNDAMLVSKAAEWFRVAGHIVSVRLAGRAA